MDNQQAEVQLNTQTAVEEISYDVADIKYDTPRIVSTSRVNGNLHKLLVTYSDKFILDRKLSVDGDSAVIVKIYPTNKEGKPFYKKDTDAKNGSCVVGDRLMQVYVVKGTPGVHTLELIDSDQDASAELDQM